VVLFLSIIGNAEISIWESSGQGGLHTEVAVEAASRAEVVGGGGPSLAARLRIETGLTVDTQVGP
jgi:hypothetical protein